MREESKRLGAGTVPNEILNSGVPVIGSNMMDMKYFFPLSIMSSVCVRTPLYPLTLIRTRLQIQTHKDVYKGTGHAFRTIFKTSGIRGLYDGYLWSNVSLTTVTAYVFTYEHVRQFVIDHPNINNKFAAGFIGGGVASFVAQLFQVPVDIINQHLQMMGMQQSTTQGAMNVSRSGFGKAAIDIAKKVYAESGILGFYRGFFMSVAVYSPNSAIFWTLYPWYTDRFSSLLPERVPRLAIQCMGAVASASFTTFILNPMDLIRARIQVERSTWRPEVRRLLAQEGIWGMFTKGVTARLSYSCLFSCSVICGYETVKRLSVLPQYKDEIKW